jgi:hypothetical protein
VNGPDQDQPLPHDSVGMLDTRGAAILATGAPGSLKDFRLRGNRLSWNGEAATLRGRGVCPRGDCWR